MMRHARTFSILFSMVAVAGAMTVVGAQGQQQQQQVQTPPAQPQQPYVAQTEARKSTDPRVGLKPGIDDAGSAIKGMELVSHTNKPENFQDPNGGFSFMNSDFAFQGFNLFLGNFH